MKKLRFNNDDIKEMLEEFDKDISKIRKEYEKELKKKHTEPFIINKKISPLNIDDENNKACIIFNPIAYIKMKMLIEDFSSEIAWYGIVDKIEKGNYYVYDIVTMAQKVTGVTVQTDDDEFAAWESSLPEEIRYRKKMHGHSHVNMGVSPSTTDLKHRKDTIDTMMRGQFYIFMIWNKSGNFSAEIYDDEDNVIYEDNDIIIDIVTEHKSLYSFLDEAHKLVKNEKNVAQNYYSKNFWEEEDDIAYYAKGEYNGYYKK